MMAVSRHVSIGDASRSWGNPRSSASTIARALAAFADSCLDGAAYPVSTEDAIRNVAVMQAIAESAAAQGAWQLLP